MVLPTNKQPQVTNQDNPQVGKVYYTKDGTPYTKHYEHVMSRKGLLYDTVLDIKGRILEKTGQDVPLKLIYLTVKYLFLIIGETLAKGKSYTIWEFGVFKPIVLLERLQHVIGGNERWKKVETHLSYSFSASDKLRDKLRATNLEDPEFLSNLSKKERAKLDSLK